MQPAIFLDRDGVIIENRARYVRSWADVQIFPQALAALAGLSQWPHKIVIVTNQSAVGRGLISLGTAQAINERLVQEIGRSGGRIDAVFMCPHAPADGCDCRKPRPGLLLQAQETLRLDLPRSVMIGDALSDLTAARAAAVGHVALVRTGRGASQEHALATTDFANGSLSVCDTLADVFALVKDFRLPSAGNTGEETQWVRR
jgi:D-glycero-D-manno-heptose 1,7-bisphosphate phosphatase